MIARVSFSFLLQSSKSNPSSSSSLLPLLVSNNSTLLWKMDCFKLRKSKPVSDSFSNSLLPGFGFTTERAKNLRSEAEPIFLFVVVVVDDDDDDQMLKLLNSETLKLLLLLLKISTQKS